MLPGLERISHKGDFGQSWIVFMKCRRQREDPIKGHNILRCMNRVEMSKTRRHGFEVKGSALMEKCKAGFFIQRVMGAWTALADVVVEANTIVAFKSFFVKAHVHAVIAGHVETDEILGHDSHHVIVGRKASSCTMFFRVLCLTSQVCSLRRNLSMIIWSNVIIEQ